MTKRYSISYPCSVFRSAHEKAKQGRNVYGDFATREEAEESMLRAWRDRSMEGVYIVEHS